MGEDDGYMLQNHGTKFGMIAAVACGLLGVVGGSVRADVSLSSVISDNMVLQEQTPVRIFGKADPAEKVSVAIQGQSAATTADAEGKWAVMLKPLKAGGPFTLTVKGKNEIDLKNILVGEVWVCSGQSNMEFALRGAYEGDKAIAGSANPNIHIFLVNKARSDRPLDDVKAKWQECSPDTVGNTSAVAYYFARDLEKARHVPIGLIETYWGGTPAESWTREEILTSNSTLKPIVDNYASARVRFDSAMANYPAAVEKAKAAGKPIPGRPNLWRYSELYNAMIAPLTPYTAKGFLWYQGESNAGQADQYRTLMPAMITNWRQDWGNRDMPFLLVQLAPFMALSAEPQDTPWAHLREAQLYTTQILPKVGMAVITDVGTAGDIHPKHKEPVGQRLALLARNIAYGEKILANGPVYKSMSVRDGKVMVHFGSVGMGLKALAVDEEGVSVAEGKLVGFTVAGKDGKFYNADAVLEGKDTVVVSSPQVPEPTVIRYGWANYPVVNLWNSENLPATPFRTDAPK
ncbi:MAG: Sialic acid-specific 9-O-acetylesterase [Chthonomonadaceae bacterium]|nr:Sialic acid-specific 9-O-acetylesterase [Chthonomonadaceae bacterium]